MIDFVLGFFAAPGPIQFYRSLANAVHSGLSSLRALEILIEGRAAFPPATLRDIAEQIKLGRPFSEGMLAHPDDFPLWQVELVRAGEASGRVDQSFRTIAELLEERRSMVLNILPGLLYPMLLLHLAPVCFYAPKLLQGDARGFLVSSICFLSIVYVPAAAAFFLFKTQSTARLARLPILSTAAKMQFCLQLSSLLKSGVSMDKALRLARAAGSLPLPNLAEAAEIGESMTARLRSFGVFTPMELGELEVAEASGKLDEALSNLGERTRERWQASLKAMANILPPVAYLFIAGAIAYRILSFYNSVDPFKQFDAIRRGAG